MIVWRAGCTRVGQFQPRAALGYNHSHSCEQPHWALKGSQRGIVTANSRIADAVAGHREHVGLQVYLLARALRPGDNR
jgi:hypothetical protein